MRLAFFHFFNTMYWMIDEDKTKELFGYYAKDLAKFSHKKIAVICDRCKEMRIISKVAAVRSKMCALCQRRIQAKKMARENRIGRKHSKETKEKIRQAHLSLNRCGSASPSYGIVRSIAHRNKIAEANRNRIWKSSSRAKMSASRKGKKASTATRQKMGLSRTGKRNPNYGKRAAHGKGKWYQRTNGNKIWLRSSWEEKTAIYLDMHELNWQYEPKAFPITYKFNETTKEGTYRPDFCIQLNSKNVYWEVKGYWRDDAWVKFEAFREQYPDIEIKLMDKEELTKMSIL